MPPKKQQKKPTGPPQDLIDQVIAMGFDNQQATLSLLKYVSCGLC